MRSRNPAHRYLAVKSSSAAPEHPYEQALWAALKSDTSDENPVVRALEIYSGVEERETLQAWILSYATDDVMETYLRVPQGVLAAYRHLFFDATVFRDELDVQRWVREYNGTEYGASLLRNAVLMGPQYLAWLFGRGVSDIEPDVVKRHIMADAFFRGRSNRAFSLTSQETKAAHAMMNTAFKAAESLGTTSAPDINQILLKLRYRDMTETVEKVAPTEEILH